MCLDSVLSRFPLSGVSHLSYDKGIRGEACQLFNIACRVSLFVASYLCIGGYITPAHLKAYLVPATTAMFFSFCWGSNPQRKVSEVFFELAIASTLIAISYSVSSTSIAGGAFGTISGGFLIGIVADRGSVREISNTQHIEYEDFGVADYVIGIARDLTLSAISIFSSFFHQKNYGSKIIDDPDAKALVVLVHGLASRPAVLDDYHHAFSKMGGITIFQPHVPKNGECSLQEAAEPIIEEVRKWCLKYPQKPVIWIGHSNGTRIVAKGTAELKIAPNPTYAFCIGGPLLGTLFNNRPDWPEGLRKCWRGLFGVVYSKEVFEEISWESDTAKGVVQGMREAALQKANLNYHFFAAPSDALVFPFDSSLPPEIERARYYVSEGEGHQGVVSAAFTKIVEITTGVV